MKKRIYILTTALLLTFYLVAEYKNGSNDYIPPGGAKLMMEVEGHDTTYLAYLHDIYVFPKKTFKNKKEQEAFHRMVRDVKRTLPFAKLVGKELNLVNLKLTGMKNDIKRKQYLAVYEKQVFNKYEGDLRKMTINQGKLLLKLIDRECSSTSYDLIKQYRGNVSAFFWQGVARIFGSNLKSEYDAKGIDKTLERIILMVESGQI